MSVQQEIRNIAKVCHHANKAFCETLGDNSQVNWEDAPEHVKNSAVDGVVFHLEAPRQQDESHANWMKFKIEDGWVYGPVKDEVKKTHPCIVEYSELPWDQQFKDAIFLCNVMALAPRVVDARMQQQNDSEEVTTEAKSSIITE